ncbi:MAG: preprotein translocase subunit YajC [Alphaproteobacteria bacterium]|nr:preprotein translocase subunit YajC [Alphaproteobacteria bacterium]MBF0250281.1 preprotein translocase subunit YajC [Alphaproteobacteria bacterium]
MFISPAYAQAAGAAPSGGDLFAQMMPLLLIFAVFYFLLIRPQQKKVKEHKLMLDALRRGDKVVTGGGIIGTVTKVAENNEVTVEIADGIKVKVVRDTITTVFAKTEPGDSAPANDDGDKGAKKEGDKGGLKKLLGG